jgi:hypothetical protein
MTYIRCSVLGYGHPYSKTLVKVSVAFVRGEPSSRPIPVFISIPIRLQFFHFIFEFGAGRTITLNTPIISIFYA